MNIYLSIDDTDNLDSPGSGQLAEILAGELKHKGLASQCSNISRHQLFFHEAIPYTSHNSSMCFTTTIGDNRLDDVIEFAKQFLKKASAPGSDPGLCVAIDDKSLDRATLTAFGVSAKGTVLSKQEAYSLANITGIHLSEHGGTGDGIIGALAGIGLRLQGNDGRFRGWLNLGESGEMTSPKSLCKHPFVDAVVDDDGHSLSEEIPVFLADSKIKTILCNHRQVIPVTATVDDSGPAWTTLTKSEIKRF
jgi:hypothetical protein